MGRGASAPVVTSWIGTTPSLTAGNVTPEHFLHKLVIISIILTILFVEVRVNLAYKVSLFNAKSL